MYDLVSMREQFSGEHEPKNDIWGTPVTYLSDDERQAYRLDVRDGKIFDAQGLPFDTRAAETLSGGSRAIFVMDENGCIYASNYQQVGEFHHSSFLAGGPVAAAGELVVEDGILKLVSDKSGHYTPDHAFTKQLVDRLKDDGVDVESIELEFVEP